MEQAWVALLAAFNFEVKYRAGRENINADALSWFPVTHPPPEQPTTNTAGLIASVAVEQEDSPALSNNWGAKQQADPDIQAVKRFVEQCFCPTGPEQCTLTAGTVRLLKQYNALRPGRGPVSQIY